MSSYRTIPLGIFSSVLLVACSSSNPRTVTTREGKTIVFKTITLVDRGFIIDSEPESFKLNTPASDTIDTIHLPRNLKGIKSLEVLHIETSPSEEQQLREELDRLRGEGRDSPHNLRAMEVRERLDELERAHSIYHLRITLDSGNVIEGSTNRYTYSDPDEKPSITDLYVKGRTSPEGLDIEIDLDGIVSIARP